jgi:hypothetical protein
VTKADICGVPHPTIEGMVCTRTTCVEYHSNGTEVWTEAALCKPSSTTNPIALAAFIHRVEERNRRSHD